MDSPMHQVENPERDLRNDLTQKAGTAIASTVDDA